MLTINKLLPQGSGLAAALLKRAATVELDWDTRQKPRFEAADSLGRNLAVVLPAGGAVRGGDVLVAEDGSLVQVKAAPQRVLKVTACESHGSPMDLARAAYHLGQRQIALQLSQDHLKLPCDPALADTLRGMHLAVAEVTEPFDPEPGPRVPPEAGHGHHAHGPDCGHGHHHHDHGEPTHAHAAAPKGRASLSSIPIRVADEPHVHGPGCGHHHDHDKH